MNVVLKNIQEKIKKNKLTKIQKNLLKNTEKFCKKYDVKIIYQNIDFINVKILEKNKNLKIIEENIKTVYPYWDLLDSKIEMKKLYNNLVLFDKFILVFSWFAFSNQKKIYNIYDEDKNKIWQITLKNQIKLKSNNNVIDSLELSWLFFKCYESYFLEFLEYFWISLEKNWILKRLDYCIDIQWLEVFELLEFLKNIHKNTKNVNSITATDKKAILENNVDFKYWKQEIYKNFFSEHNDLKIYDKILDILENYLKRKVNGKNPYQDYLDSDLPIVRIELKKKKFKNLTDNSIKWVFQNIEALFFDYLKRYFDIDLSLYLRSWKNSKLKKNLLS